MQSIIVIIIGYRRLVKMTIQSERIDFEMKAQFSHYWQEDVILTEEERKHQRRIAQALNQGFVFTVPEGSELNGQVYTDHTKRELRIMIFKEHDTPPDMMSYFLDADDYEPEEDDELGKRLADREPSEREPAIFLTMADQNAATAWVFFQ